MPIRITEADLRAAMRDPRYTQANHPERRDYGDWVTGGWRALHPADADQRTEVWVREYVRNGHRVAAHWRQAPSGGDGDPVWNQRANNAARDSPIQRVSLFRYLGRLIPRSPAGGRGSGSATPRPPRDRTRRFEDAEGRDQAEALRRDPGTRPDRGLRGDVDQWTRPGGTAQRARDVDALRPVGEPVPLRGGAVRFAPQDGRIAITRPSTSAGQHPTLEIAEPIPGSARFTPTDKLRYPNRR